jgi:ankyrin repeat protein
MAISAIMMLKLRRLPVKVWGFMTMRIIAVIVLVWTFCFSATSAAPRTERSGFSRDADKSSRSYHEQRRLNDMLVHAAMGCDVKKARTALASGADPNGLGDDRSCAMDWAVECASPEIARMLLEKGADVDGVPNGTDHHPLYRAAEHERNDTVRILVRHGAAINGMEGGGALWMAVSRNRKGVAKALIAAGADVNVAGDGGLTPLALAAIRGDATFSAYLIDRGANLDVRDKFGKTPVLWAAYLGHENIIDLLRTATAVIEHGRKISGPKQMRLDRRLVDACEKGDFEGVRRLLRGGADVNAAVPWFASDDRNDFAGIATPLCSAGWADKRIASLLLAHGADPNLADSDGMTPLILSVNRPEIVDLLLAHGAKVNQVSPRFGTALGQCGDVKVMRVLVAHGADVNLGSRTSGPPLIALLSPSSGGLGEAAAFLLAHGSNVNARWYDGSTALMQAALCTSEVSVYCDPGIGKVLIAHGADVNAVDNIGTTALMLVAQTEYDDDAVKFARMLIAHGARADLRDKKLNTALDYAQRGGLTKLVRLLTSVMPRAATSVNSKTRTR